ncbi:MAG: hypothetical protein EXR28_14215 [Betaproteobacteria bacterium]|nr:hypothetical protein [Betaproteobacteria bacterium]
MAKQATIDRSPGSLTKYVVYALALPVMYFAMTPEITGNFNEGQARGFRVAAVKQIKDANGAAATDYFAYTLLQIQSGKIDMASVSFLLPQNIVNVFPDSGDENSATVLERHLDWQLIEYRFGNSYSSTSRYRAFKDRVEPVSYRITMGIGLFFGAIFLLIPVWIVSAAINAIWNAVTRRNERP